MRAASGALVASVGVAGTAAAGGKKKGGKKKVPICHKNKKTLYLPKKAAKKHVKKHGDTWGPCPKKKKKKYNDA